MSLKMTEDGNLKGKIMRENYKKKIAAFVLAALLLCGCGGDGTAYLQKAEEQLKKENYSRALELYNKAIMEDEDLLKAYRGAGIASLKMADYEKAKDFFLRALKKTDGIISKDEVVVFQRIQFKVKEIR